MSWAKFKAAVLIFLAARLARWADFIARKIDYRQLEMPAVEDNSESFPDDEPRSDVPEHWARLVARRPPQAWLDLIRERAPHLLSNTGDELLSEEGVEIFERERLPTDDELTAFEDDAVRRSRPETPRPEKRREESRYYAEKNRRATWLKRLRFQPPAPSSTSETVYLKNSATRRQTFASTPEHERSAAGDERQVSFPARQTRASSQPKLEHPRPLKRRDAAPGIFARFFKRSTRKANSSDAENRWANVESATSRDRHDLTVVHPQDQKQSDLSYPFAASDFNSVRNDAVKAPAAGAEHRKSPSLRLLRFNDKKQSSSSRIQQNVNERTTNVTPVSSLALQHVKRQRVIAVSSHSESQATDKDRTRNVIDVRTPERARNEFASLDFPSSEHDAPRGEYKAPLSESGESVWPALPAAHDWEPADEVAATQREAERVRRLELEQRGALWNA